MMGRGSGWVTHAVFLVLPSAEDPSGEFRWPGVGACDDIDWILEEALKVLRNPDRMDRRMHPEALRVEVWAVREYETRPDMDNPRGLIARADIGDTDLTIVTKQGILGFLWPGPRRRR